MLKRLYNLIQESKDWLGERLMVHAAKGGYERYYDGDKSIWVLPLHIISNNLLKIIEENLFGEQLIIEDKSLYNTVAAFGIGNIVKHYKENIDVGIFVGTMKCYKNCYVDLVAEKAGSDENKYKYLNFLNSFFDRLEIISCSEWSKTAESEIKFNTLAETSSAFIFMFDGEKFVYINKAVEEFTGYTKEEMGQMKLEDIYHPEFKEKIQEFEFNITHEGRNINRTYELKILTKQGEERWIEFNSGIMDFGDKSMMLGIAFNIDKRKKAEEDLKKSEERYRKLLELMPDAVFVYSLEEILYTNIAGAKLLGAASPADIIGQDSRNFLEIDPERRVLTNDNLEYILREGSLPPMEQRFLRKSDGKLVELETTATLVPYKEGMAILDISRDMSEKKKVQELNDKVMEKTRLLEETVEYDKLKTEFFANISHELRTPLNVILGSLQLLDLIQRNEGLCNGEQQVIKYKEIMKQNCYRLIRLVNNLIDITKIDAGFFELSPLNKNIVSIVEDITLSVADYINSKGITLVFDTEMEERVIACDPDMIERIMLNLLSNAVKFTPEGGSIEVQMNFAEGRVFISVNDSGIGIPEEKQKFIFDRFIQVDKSLSRGTEGSGIGLSLVKSLVEMHGGSIRVESTKGEGSNFIIELPEAVIDEEEFMKPGTKKLASQSNIERINIEFADIYS